MMHTVRYLCTAINTQPAGIIDALLVFYLYNEYIDGIIPWTATVQLIRISGDTNPT